MNGIYQHAGIIYGSVSARTRNGLTVYGPTPVYICVGSFAVDPLLANPLAGLQNSRCTQRFFSTVCNAGLIPELDQCISAGRPYR